MKTPLMTSSDHAQLRQFIASHRDLLFSQNRQLTLLDQKLDRARVLPSLEIPPWVVTMHSTVQVRYRGDHRTTLLTLVFPQEASLSRSRISVLTSLGTALLGAGEGDEIPFDDPNSLHGDEPRSCMVLRILYQPEAARSIGQNETWIAREWYPHHPAHVEEQQAEGDAEASMPRTYRRK